VLVYAFLFLPILVMAVFAFNKPSAAALASFHGTNVCAVPPAQIGNIAVWNGFTGCWFSAGLHDPTFIPAIIVSLQIAAEASVIATVLGLCAALALARMRPRLRAPFDSLVYLTLVVPEIVIAVASLIFFVQARKVFPAFPGLGNVTILIGQVVFNASLTMLIIRARFVGMGDTLEEAAYDLGSGPLATFRQITLPRLAPAIVAAALLSFTFSFDDYVLPAFTNGTTNTWPIVLYSAVRFGLTPAVNALATIMLGVTLAAVVVTAVVLRRSRRRVTAGRRSTAQPALSAETGQSWLAGHGPVDADLLRRRRDRARRPAPFGDHHHTGRHQGQSPERQVGELAPVSHIYGHAALLVRADATVDPLLRRVFRSAV
jgi:spermidine/putrescine transport system permease protein/putrescine transport system permease protein